MLSAVYIKGFKTFARPVRMPLEGGLTVIVGPNGSGKSNITDAVLFALGEQSPGVLRAGAMGDLIFSGSETLNAAAAAEVTLVIDNESGVVSLPYGEVSITRRISRAGDTEYRINGARSRLADVRAVSGEAGLGRHSILRQGSVDAIVSGGPAACRLALEEAAGLGVYRRRRLSASRRLERSATQLEKSRQLEAELENQLKRIEKEAVAAREYRELESRYRKLSLAYLYRMATRDQDALRSRLESEEARVSGLAAREEKLREERTRLEPEIQKIETELRGREKNLEALENLSESLRAESLRADRALLRLESVKSRETERARTKLRLEEELRKVDQNLSDLEAQAALIENEYSTRREELGRREEAAAAARKEHVVAGERLARLTGNLERLRARQEVNATSDEKATVLGEADRERISSVAKDLARPPAKDLREDLDGIRKSLDGLRRVAEGLAADANRRRGALAAARGAAEAHIRNLRAASENGDSGTRLYQVIRARPGFEAAVEAALGEVGSGVLARDLGEGIKLLSDTERIAVRLDAEGVESESSPPGKPLLKCVEVVDTRYSAAVERILGGIYVVDDPDENAPNNGYVTVTRRGLRLTRTSVSLANTGGRFELQSRLSNEEERLTELESGPGEILDSLQEAVSDASGGVERLSRDTETLQSLSARTRRVSSLLAREALRRVEKVERDQEALGRRREQFGELEREIRISASSLQSVENETKNAEEKLAAADSATGSAREEFRQVEQRRSRLRSRVAETRSRRNRVCRALESLKKNPDEDSDYLARITERSARFSETLAQGVLERRSNLRRLRAEAAERHRRLTGEQGLAASRAAELSGELARLRAETRRLREDLEAMQNSASEATEELSTEWAATLEIAREESEKAPADVEAERSRLARKIKRFGDVNLLSLSQESLLRERHEFVSTQRSDAEDAANELNRIIQNVDREIEERFSITFAGARDAFREMVPRMLGGASGELGLSEEGVEIGIRLGRRGHRPLNVLSGGERSLLALSFLFSIFLSRRENEHRSFCVLDEAEAALDDLNLARFLSVVDSYRSSGQFLLVTHQKRTMAAADVLYGVTQDASGATAVVSKRLSGD
ncbi:MAG: chromosome segregation protein SMC [Rubrobacteraceae bacterium]